METYRVCGHLVCDEEDLLEIFSENNNPCQMRSASVKLAVVFQAASDKTAEVWMLEALEDLDHNNDVNGTITLERGVLIGNHFQVAEIVRQIKLVKKS